MTGIEKKCELSNLIWDTLTPLIDCDYLLLDVPYYWNLGDILIWQGTKDFLKRLPYKCLKETNARTLNFKLINKKYPNAVVLLQGGGNFGDIWSIHQDFRREVIKNMPNHKIIILPQSLYYKSEDVLRADSELFNKHKNLTICVRDRHSLDVSNKYFDSCNVLLLPDMAFCMKISKHLKIGQDKGNLFIKRNDVELAEMAKYYIVPNDVEVKDWPLVESQRYLPVRIECVLERWIRNILGKGTACKFADIYWQNILRRYCVNMAIDFLKDRRTIYSTRMHAVILSVILGKQDIYVFDNSYGKISSFIDCWLNDVDVVKLI